MGHKSTLYLFSSDLALEFVSGFSRKPSFLTLILCLTSITKINGSFFFFFFALHTGCSSIFQCIILHSTLLFYLPISTARLWTLSGQKQWFLFLPQTTSLCPGPITFSTNVWWRNGWINGVFQGMWVPRAEIVQFFYNLSSRYNDWHKIIAGWKFWLNRKFDTKFSGH